MNWRFFWLTLFTLQFIGAANALGDQGLDCSRIISLSPSVSEIIYRLNLNKQLVGVSRYCKYPPAVLQKPKVGGFLDPNLEAIVAKQPSLVLLLREQTSLTPLFQQLGASVLNLDHRNINGILSSITKIGEACSRQSAAKHIRNKIEKELKKIEQKTKNKKKSKTLIVVGRSGEPDTISNLYVSGSDGFYHQMLKLAGGVNVYPHQTASLPAISAEGLINLNPEVIIEVVPDLEAKGWTRDKIIEGWKRHPHIAAVRNMRIHILENDYSEIPGPRFILALKDMAKILHPEINFDD